MDKGYFIMDTTNENVEEDNKRYNKFQNNYEETKEYIEKDVKEGKN